MRQVRTNPVLDAARGYRAAGLSVIPIGLDGLKRPAFGALPRVPDREGGTKPTWAPFRHRLATAEELDRWFGGPRPYGIALVCGAISGGLECIDFDDRAAAAAFLGAVRGDRSGPIDRPIDRLIDRLSLEETPRGLHVWYRCPVAGPNRKLAWPSRAECRRTGVPFRALAETRGEGGCAVVAGSPLDVHELKRPYRHVGGPPLTRLTRLTDPERDALLRGAAAVDRSDPRPFGTETRAHEYGGGYWPRGSMDLAPADDYDLRGEPFSDLLPGAAFSHPGRDAGAVRRPGKDRGWSATVGYCRGARGEPLLKVFTSSWPPFEPGRCYGRFHVLRLVRFDGNGSAAVRWLREQGFGAPVMRRPPPNVVSHASGVRPDAVPFDN